jgi:hypothetical protein
MWQGIALLIMWHAILSNPFVWIRRLVGWQILFLPAGGDVLVCCCGGLASDDACLPCLRAARLSLQKSGERIPDNIVAGRRMPLRKLGIADDRHMQLVDAFTQVRAPMRAAFIFVVVWEIARH